MASSKRHPRAALTISVHAAKMKKLLKDRWPILALPLLFYVVDEALTWAGQPRPPAGLPPSQVFEMNPVVRHAMAAGLAASISLNLAWVVMLTAPTLLLPRFWAICYSFAWAFGHAAAVMVWLVYPFAFGLGYWTLYWYCPPVALSFVLVARRMFTLPPLPATRV